MEAAETKATVRGTSHANLRAGPGLNHPSKIVLNEGDLLTVEAQEGDWYLVTAADGQKGYVHRTVLNLAGEAQAPVVVIEPSATKPAVTESKGPNKPITTDTPVSSTASPPVTPVAPASTTQPSPTPAPQGKPSGSVSKPDDHRTPVSKSPSLIQLLEGREADMILWAAIAVGFFLIGWVSGGNYYLRRDRARRTKLRF